MFINTSVSKWKKAEEGNRKERKANIKHCNTSLWFRAGWWGGKTLSYLLELQISINFQIFFTDF